MEMKSRGDLTGSASLCFTHCTNRLEQMHKVLPKYQSKTIVDISIDFRKYRSDICGREISGRGSALNYLFWNNQRLGAYYTGGMGGLGGEQNEQHVELSLQYTNQALSLLPKLREGEIPHREELYTRIERAEAMLFMKDYDAALVEFRVVVAGIRLLDHAGIIDMGNSNDDLVKRVNIWPHTMIRMTIKLKQRNGVPRPYFMKDEYLDLMKELAYGIYSPQSQKCINCGSTEKLSLCSGCKGAWFCDKSCAKKAWKAGHKDKCGAKKYTGDMMGQKQTIVPFCVPADYLRKILDELLDKEAEGDMNYITGSMGISILNCGDRNFLVLCRDSSSGEIFDAFTDQPFQLLEGTTIPLGSKMGHAVNFACIPDEARNPLWKPEDEGGSEENYDTSDDGSSGQSN